MKNKDSKARMQVIFGVLLFAFVMSAEMYAMINFPDMYLGIVGLAAIDLVCLYVVINGLFALREIKDARNEEQYDSVFKSEKASYLMLKKYFVEIEDKLNYLEKAAKVPTEEIINAQKGIAKVIINWNRENTEALMNSNDQVMEQFVQCNDAVANITKLLGAYKDEIVSEQKKTEDVNEQSIQVKMQDLVIQMKDMELRLNQAINQIQKVGYQQPVVAPTCLQQPQASVDRTEMTASTETIHDEDAVPEVVAENNDPDIELDPNGPSEGLNANASDADTADLDAAEDALADLSIPETVDEPAVQPEVPEEKPIVEEKATEPEPITEEQPVAEEKPAMPDLSDPNKKMSPDEIAALFANMSGDASKEESKAEQTKIEEPVKEPAITIEQAPETVEEKPVEAEPIVEEVPKQPAVEEKPAMPDLSDPNKTLSPDEIAALFANMSDNAPKEEEKPVEAEPIVEEVPQEQPATEEKPPMPDLSDPNKTLSPDEIAALFANMQ